MLHNPDWLFSQNTLFKSVFNNTIQNTILIMDKDGIIMAVNRAFTNCFGYQPEDIIGKYMGVLYTNEAQKQGLPEKEIKDVLFGGQGSDNNYLVSKDKTVTWVSGESVLAKNDNGEAAIVKIIQNIHKQKESETSVQRLNEFNEDILSAIKDAVVILDAEMNLIKANSVFTSLFTPDWAALIPVNFVELISAYDHMGELQNNIRQAIISKKPFQNIPIEIKTVDGEARIYDITSSEIQDVHGNDNLLLIIHDITLHKQIERGREDLIGFVAHELRNPLANLVLCNDLLDVLLNENKVKEANDILKRSKNNVMRLNKMIAELYNATKIDSGNLVLEISTFNFGVMVMEAVETVEALQPDYKITVNGSGNIEIPGDKYRLIEVVTNYISNGIKYSNGNTTVSLSMYYDDVSATVSVQDEGLGIAKEQLPYVFERYFRAEKTKNLEGVGLGLYLCRRIILAHKGKVWVESEEGKGSSFYFSIPR